MSRTPQYRRTDKAIILALSHLLQRKPFEKITIQDILDETPVTRATFYAHFRDKYDIVEQVMENFLEQRRCARQVMFSPNAPSPIQPQASMPAVQEDLSILLKVRTGHVDFRQNMAKELEQEYLSGQSDPNALVASRIYAQASVEMYLALMNGELEQANTDYIRQLMVPVAMQLLQLQHDPETEAFLLRRIQQIPVHSSYIPSQT